MADEVKNEKKLSGKAEFIKLVFSSTRFKVVLAAIVAIYLIVDLCVEAPSPSDAVLKLALWGCILITGLACVHIVLRTWKDKNGSDAGANDVPADLPSD